MRFCSRPYIEVITAPLRYFKYDLGAMLKLVDKKTKLVFIANPNNPTGTYVTKYEVEEFLNALPEDVVVVFDQAYDTFIDVDDYPDSLSYLRRRKNVILLKTFSKAYGLAGLRLGYAIALKAVRTVITRSSSSRRAIRSSMTLQ